MTTLQTVTAGTGADTRVNENFQQVSPSALYAKDPVTSTGLTWGYKGGMFNGLPIADGTVALTASATNYVVYSTATGAVSVSTTTTNWGTDTVPATGYGHLYKLVVGASTVTSPEDHRQAVGVVSPVPVASATQLGGVKVGTGLAIDGSGVLSATAAAPATQSLTDFANAVGTTTGLTYGYQAGVIRQDNVTTAVAAGTVALTASTTNYVEVTGAGAVSANTVGFTSGRYPLCTVLTGASAITTITDKRGVISLGAGVQLGGVNVFTKNQSVAPSALTSGATIAVDASLSNNFKLVLGVNATLSNPTNPTDGMVVNIRIKQDATGSRTLAYGTAYKWPGGTAGVLSTAANAVDLLSMYYDSTDAVWACVLQKGFA